MITYLQSKGIEIKQAGNEVRANCFFCQDTKGHLYLNPDKEVFFCHLCGEAGNIWKLKKHFGDVIEPKRIYQQKFKTPEKGLDLKFYEAMKNSPEAVKFLMTERGFTKETIEHFKLGFREGFISIPYYKNGELVNFKYRKISEKVFKRETDCESTIFNIDKIDRTKDIIITEGELDCVSAWQMGFTNSVSVSIGAGSINEGWMDFFENCSSNIYLAYDNDEKGEEGAKKLSERIGLARCYRIKLPFKDFNECMMSGIKPEEITDLISSAESYKPSRIKHATQIISDLEEEMRHGDKGKGLQLPEKWKSLNELLGGIRLCEVSILTGETASGKTTWALNLFDEFLANDKSVIILSSEMPATKVMSKMFSMYIGQKIEYFTDEDLAKAIMYYSKKNLFFIDVHGEMDMKELELCLEYAKAKYNIEYVMIDHLHFLIDRKKDNQVQAIELFMRDIVNISIKCKLHSLVIAHPSKLNNTSGVVEMNDLKGGSSIKQDAHNVMIIFRDRKKEEQGIHQIVLDIQKVRDPSGTGGKKRYDFDINSQTYKETNDTGTQGRNVSGMPTKGLSGKGLYNDY
jgi:twinkle protein